MTLSGPTTVSQSGYGGNGTEGVLHILQSFALQKPHHKII